MTQTHHTHITSASVNTPSSVITPSSVNTPFCLPPACLHEFVCSLVLAYLVSHCEEEEDDDDDEEDDEFESVSASPFTSPAGPHDGTLSSLPLLN